MKRKFFPTLCLMLFITLSACGAEHLVAPLPTAVPSPIAKPLTIFSAHNVNQIIEQSNLGQGKITSGEFSPDGKHFGTITPLGVYIYNVKTLKQEQFLTDGSGVNTAAFSSDWSLIAVGTDSTVKIQRFVNQETVTQLESEKGKVSRLLFSPDGSLLAILLTPPGEEVYSQTVELWLFLWTN